MNFKRILTCAGVALSGVVAIATAPAHATNFNFSTFNFSNSVSGQMGTNQMLNSVSYGGATYRGNQLVMVNRVNVVQNDRWTGNNTGAASADFGLGATIGVKSEAATGTQFAQALGNLNMNSIVDTEDTGSFTLEVTFAQAARDFLLWERGRNSRLLVEALDAAGGVIGRYLVDSSKNPVQDAGFRILTQEISGGMKVKDIKANSGQTVGSLGLRLNRATNRLRLISRSNFNGADFKVMAAVPEPMTITGTALAAGAFFAARRKKRKSAAAVAEV